MQFMEIILRAIIRLASDFALESFSTLKIGLLHVMCNIDKCLNPHFEIHVLLKCY